MENRVFTPQEFVRIANNFYNSIGSESQLQRIGVDSNLFNYFAEHTKDLDKKYKVAFVWVCLNQPYWEFAKPMIEGAKQFFLPGHEVDYFLWSDMPEPTDEKFWEQFRKNHIEAKTPEDQVEGLLAEAKQYLTDIRKIGTIFPTEAMEWPMPTLMRYHLFLQQEEVLSKYDYIFYCDCDMKFVDVVGDEVLGDLTTGVNPMYYLDKSMYPPYEPNSESASYIPRPGRIIMENGQKRFQPLYYAGGFQGGKSEKYIEAMKKCREMIDKDLAKGYIPIWNEESAWNKYLFENPPSVVLNPSYIYPDSLHNEYYIPRWGQNYQPKLITLTKKFSLRQLSPQEQEQLTMMQKK